MLRSVAAIRHRSLRQRMCKDRPELLAKDKLALDIRQAATCVICMDAEADAAPLCGPMHLA